MSLSVSQLQEADFPRWDEFVFRHPLGTCFHQTAWRKTIESTFQFRPYYLTVLEDGELQAVLPMFLVENWMMGRVLISSPFAVYGGILALTDAAKERIRDEVVALATKLSVQHVELRNTDEEQRLGFSPVDRYLTYTQTVRRQAGEELLAELPKKTRNMVRKSLKSPFASRIAEGLDGFYELLSRNYRRLGTPIFPRQYFQTLLEEFGPKGADVREILIDGEVAAVSLNLFFRDQMHTYYAASHTGFLPLAPNNFLYYDHLLWAGEHGFTTFDFGRSKIDSGTSDFKRHWNTTTKALPYEILLVNRKDLPNFSPSNQKFSLAIRAWQHLPLGLTRSLGPRLVRLFP